jgi:hypothetical protein
MNFRKFINSGLSTHTLKQAMKVLDDNNIEYTIERGFSEFNFTSLVFKNYKIASKAADILGKGIIISTSSIGDPAIKFYG